MTILPPRLASTCAASRRDRHAAKPPRGIWLGPLSLVCLVTRGPGCPSSSATARAICALVPWLSPSLARHAASTSWAVTTDRSHELCSSIDAWTVAVRDVRNCLCRRSCRCARVSAARSRIGAALWVVVEAGSLSNVVTPAVCATALRRGVPHPGGQKSSAPLAPARMRLAGIEVHVCVGVKRRER